MNLEQRKNAFVHLGHVLRSIFDEEKDLKNEELGDFPELMEQVPILNPWFTRENVRRAVKSIALQLTEENLDQWLRPYRQKLEVNEEPREVAVIMAGNIPLVGFHDLLSVLISGNHFLGRLSSKDDKLLPALAEVLKRIESKFQSGIRFTDERIGDPDAVIATGSDNTSRYFEYYFGKYPHIIRKNRNGVAILDGMESEKELRGLAEDIFSYFGLGCRNVSKIYIPQDSFDEQTGENELLKRLDEVFQEHQKLLDHSKYSNNYHYNKALFVMNGDPVMDNGFLIFKADSRIASPLGTLFYESYQDKQALRKHLLEERREEIQCLVSREDLPFGQAQHPRLWDYADEVDTVEFLGSLWSRH